jgi:hypothetical protein
LVNPIGKLKLRGLSLIVSWSKNKGHPAPEKGWTSPTGAESPQT